ncbi:hypothetical protein A9X04_18350 [Mycobacterium sp. E3247]|nr:hypothetical protein A9X04_18350 [Mycobacterium sp. E3247]
MRRNIFAPIHDQFRQTARAYFDIECAPNADKWEREGKASREAWRAAGKHGTKLDSAQCYLDQCVLSANDGTLTDEDAAGLKWWTSEVQWEIIDRCLQLHGGYGYINEYEIARLWRDSRVQRLYAGTTEIMKDLMGRAMGF